MPMNAGDIERLIKEGIPDAQVTIRGSTPIRPMRPFDGGHRSRLVSGRLSVYLSVMFRAWLPQA